MTDIKYIDIDEFQRLGFLQEVNRLFLHPRGLALEVIVDDDGAVALGGVWDYRDDTEGMVFGDLSDADSRDKAAVVEAEFQRHVPARLDLFGEVIQPIGDRRGG